MAKNKKVETKQEEQKYVPRNLGYYIFVRDKYYKRLQPIPYAHKLVNVKEKLGLK